MSTQVDRSTTRSVRTLLDLTLEEINELSLKISKLILEDPQLRYLRLRSDNCCFLLAMKKAGIENAREIIDEAANVLIENTIKRYGRRPPILKEEIALWLSAWREIEQDLNLVQLSVARRLILMRMMVRGEMWIKEVGQNIVVITNGEATYKLGNGYII